MTEQLTDHDRHDGEVQEQINGYWSRRAAAYDDYQQRPERRELDRRAWTDVWRSALPRAAYDVLDVGTGSGHVACLLASMGHRVTGVDLADGMLERAREHAARMPRAPYFVRGDAVDPPFPPGTFDAVVGRYLTWTLREPDRAFAAWRQLLRPGGRLALVDTAWFPRGWDASQESAPDEFGDAYDATVRQALPLAEGDTMWGLQQRLREAGFADIDVHPLHRVLELDLEHGVAPGHEVRTQYLVTARR